MPVRFEARARRETYKIASVTITAPLYAIIGSDRSYDRVTQTHYLLSERKTVPCLHEECTFCGLIAKRQNAYLAAQIYSHESNAWRLGIVFLSDGMQEFLKEDREKVCWEFSRKVRYNAPVRYRRTDRFNRVPEFAGMDIEPSVLRAWGMWKNLRRKELETGAIELQACEGERAMQASAPSAEAF